MSNSSNSSLDELTGVLKQLIRFSTALNKEDIQFYNSIDSQVQTQSNETNTQLLNTMNEIVECILSITPDLNIDDLKFKLDSNSENLNVLSNVLDTLFENVEISLDKHQRAKLNNKSTNNTVLDNDGYTYLDENDANNNAVGTKSNRMPHSSNIVKPQSQFIEKINNFENTPFKPLLTIKPNSVKSLEESLKLTEPTDEIPAHYENPYEFEILNSDYPSWILNDDLQNEFQSTSWKDSAPAIWIKEPNQLKDLLTDLNKSRVIAIDLEHHDYRTYHGLTCLMQITSESKRDYLIDPLEPSLRPHLQILNEVFTNPNIVKVLHGAFMDVIWLQRDLGLYLVSLFDTYHASKQLSLTKHSLAYLLEKYVKFRTSKKWQLADWRIRPLSNEMKDYAKADTHFLIEVFYKMQSELLKIPNALQRTLYESRKVANRRFEYSTFQPKNLQMIKNKTNVVATNGSVPLTPEIQNQLCSFNFLDRDLPWSWLITSNGVPLIHRPLLEMLYKWRDQKAREEDESPRYIMSDFILISLANSFDIVSSNVNIDDISNGRVLEVINKSAKFGGGVFIRKFVDELVSLIQNGVEELRGFDLNTLNDLVQNTTNNDKLIQDMSNNNVNIDESVYENVKDVNKLQQDFNSLMTYLDMSTGNGNGNGSSSRVQPLPSNETKNVFALEYKSNGEINNVESIQNRIIEVVNHFKDDQGEIIELDVEDEVVEDEQQRQEEENQRQKAKKIAEEKEEIITLRKRGNNGNNNNKKRKLEQESNENKDDLQTDFLDFSKSVMGNAVDDKRRNKTKKNGKNKQPTFDPYSKIDSANGDIPQFKKKQRVDRGKNAVFKRK